jgi:hypothetical protein
MYVVDIEENGLNQRNSHDITFGEENYLPSERKIKKSRNQRRKNVAGISLHSAVWLLEIIIYYMYNCIDIGHIYSI